MVTGYIHLFGALHNGWPRGRVDDSAVAKPPVGIKVIHIVNRVPLLLILLPMDSGRG